jgi:50S ribosomal protein L16 3-hydroxylase
MIAQPPRPAIVQNAAMEIDVATTLLGGLTPAAFMRRHWQKRPLLVRQAWPAVQPPLHRAALFALAAQDGVESRLVDRFESGWRVRHGPLNRRALPPVGRAGWTLLVQGLDLHVPAAHRMLQHFRFVPDARLDDLMVSWASQGGGVGPHVDSYDVFLLQVQGRRRWQVAPPLARGVEPAWIEGAPLKLLRDFRPAHDWLLEPGDMLYLPPGWGHEGTSADPACMTCSVGFRAPAAGELAGELLLRLADEGGSARLYRDPRQRACTAPAAVPAGLEKFARQALARHLADPQALARALGEVLSEPKANVWFSAKANSSPAGLVLDAGTRMLYDDRHIFMNGEAFEARGRDAAVLRNLANERRLGSSERRRLSEQAAAVVAGWLAAGWVHAELA